MHPDRRSVGSGEASQQVLSTGPRDFEGFLDRSRASRSQFEQQLSGLGAFLSTGPRDSEGSADSAGDAEKASH